MPSGCELLFSILLQPRPIINLLIEEFNTSAENERIHKREQTLICHRHLFTSQFKYIFFLIMLIGNHMDWIFIIKKKCPRRISNTEPFNIITLSMLYRKKLHGTTTIWQICAKFCMSLTCYKSVEKIGYTNLILN